MDLKQEAAKWLAFADEDLAYGKLGLGRFPRAAAWSFQQAAEKAMKACLISTGHIPPRTHDIVLLHNLQERESSEDVREAVLKLAEITSASRYPDDLDEMSAEMAAEHEKAAILVVTWAHYCLEDPKG